MQTVTEQAVEQRKEQALGAVDTYFNFLQKTISSYPSGGTDVGEKLKSYAGKNVAATYQFVHELSQAKNFQEIVRLQTEFMQAASAFGEQIKGLGRAPPEKKRHDVAFVSAISASTFLTV